MSRDMVVYNIDGTPYLFAVKTAGNSFKSTVSPDKDTDNWEKASSPYSMLFANFVYTDNASVAGFKWSDEVMQSPNGLLELNGKTGKITAKSGKIGGLLITDITIQTTLTSSDHRPIIALSAPSGFLLAQNAEITGKITAKSGTFDNCTINETCKVGSLIMVANKVTSSGVVSCGYISGQHNSIVLPSVSSGEYKRIIYHNPRFVKSGITSCVVTCEGSVRFCDNGRPYIGSSATIVTQYAEFHGFYDDSSGKTVWDIHTPANTSGEITIS